MKLVLFISIVQLILFNCQAADNIATLHALYPDQSGEFIRTRIDNAKNVHKFYRTFVRYYYSTMKKNPGLITSLAPVKKFSGVVSGDPHVENFGFLVDKNHHAHFNFNDFDDADRSILAFDVLRHLISSMMVKPKLDLEQYFQYYLAGLEGEEAMFPSGLKDLKEKAEQQGHRLSDEDINLDDKTFADYKKVVLKMSDDEIADTQKKLEVLLQKELDPTIKIYEIYKRTKDSGGSAGLVRYEVLLMIRNKLQWLELKEFTTPATASYAKTTNSKNERIDIIRENLLPAQVKDEFDLITFQGKSFMTCYIWDGEKGVDLEKIAENEWNDIMYVEVQFLGYLHGKNLTKQQLSPYRNAVSELPIENWKSAAKKMIEKFSETYKNVKN